MLIPFRSLIEKYGIHPKGVLHCGASTAQEASDYYNNGVQKTIWIEALSDRAEMARVNLLKYPEAKVYNVCVSDTDGEAVLFHVTNNYDSSSFLELGTHAIVHPEVKVIGNIPMKTKRIDSLLTESDLEGYDFLNLDLQGSELLALKGMGDLLNQFKSVYCEVNKNELYIGCALIEEIESYLFGYGFEMREVKYAGNTGWGDAFFQK